METDWVNPLITGSIGILGVSVGAIINAYFMERREYRENIIDILKNVRSPLIRRINEFDSIYSHIFNVLYDKNTGETGWRTISPMIYNEIKVNANILAKILSDLLSLIEPYCYLLPSDEFKEFTAKAPNLIRNLAIMGAYNITYEFADHIFEEVKVVTDLIDELALNFKSLTYIDFIKEAKAAERKKFWKGVYDKIPFFRKV